MLIWVSYSVSNLHVVTVVLQEAHINLLAPEFYV